MAIHYLNQRYACLLSPGATCKYTRRRATPRWPQSDEGQPPKTATDPISPCDDVDDGGRGGAWHPANSIPPLLSDTRRSENSPNADAADDRVAIAHCVIGVTIKNLARV